MATLTAEQAAERIRDSVQYGVSVDDLDTDNDGRLILYTNIYRWKDGSYHESAEDLTLNPSDIPVDFPVKPLLPGKKAEAPAMCGTCGLSWDDAIPTSYTPAPSARCPFEYFHK